MKLKRLGRKQVLLTTNHGYQILYSYDKPVAGFSPKIGLFKHTKFFSQTTSTHIDDFIKGRDCVEMTSEDIEHMFEEMVQ